MFFFTRPRRDVVVTADVSRSVATALDAEARVAKSIENSQRAWARLHHIDDILENDRRELFAEFEEAEYRRCRRRAERLLEIDEMRRKLKAARNR